MPGNNERQVGGSPFALTIASLKAGCHVEGSLQNIRHPHHACFTALQGTHGNPWSNQVHFNSDSFPTGVDNHASYCYVNSPHLLDDLVLSNKGSVDGYLIGYQSRERGHSSSPSRMTMAGDTISAFPNLSTYLG